MSINILINIIKSIVEGGGVVGCRGSQKGG
jgi:hypothetical protein